MGVGGSGISRTAPHERVPVPVRVRNSEYGPRPHGKTGAGEGQHSSIGPMTDFPGRGSPLPHPKCRRCAARGRARAAAREGPSAAGKAGRGPDHARHPPGPHGGAPEAPRVPGPRPHRGADHRRLHRAGGRSERALGAAAVRRGRGDRPERGDLPAAGVQGARPRPDRGAPQRRVARHGDGGPVPAGAARPRWPRSSSATTSRTAIRPASRSRSSSCSIRCSRAMTRWRSSRTSSSAAPTRSSTSSSRARYRRPTGVEPQSVLTMPILPGIDGVQKMSKSLGNYVGVDDPPEEMYGKLMRVPDEAMPTYYTLLLDEEPGADPREAKRHMARALTARYHGDEAAAAAEERFDTLHVRQGAAGRHRGTRLPARKRAGPPSRAHGRGIRPVALRGAPAPHPGWRAARRRRARRSHAGRAAPTELDGAVLQVGRRRFKKLRQA